MTAGPDGIRDPNPNTSAASKAGAPNGFSGSSVRPIVISFSSFIPASTRGSNGHQLMPAVRPMRRCDPCRGPSRCSVSAEAAWRLERLELGQIEFDNRPQGFRERTVLLVVRQRDQPVGVFDLQL